MRQPKVIVRGNEVKVKTPALYNQYFSSIISSKYIKKKGYYVFPVEAIPDIMEKTKGIELDADDEFYELGEKFKKERKRTKEILTKENPKKYDRYPFLMRHQARCVELAEANDKFAMFLDTGK
jgi:hypothetical protein